MSVKKQRKPANRLKLRLVAKSLKDMPLEKKIDLLVRAKLMSPEEAAQSKAKAASK